MTLARLSGKRFEIQWGGLDFGFLSWIFWLFGRLMQLSCDSLFVAPSMYIHNCLCTLTYVYI